MIAGNQALNYALHQSRKHPAIVIVNKLNSIRRGLDGLRLLNLFGSGHKL